MSSNLHILIVEDSRFFSQLVARNLTERTDARVVVAASLAAARDAVAQTAEPFDLALVDIVLPDSVEGEAVEFLRSKKIPCIVFTSIFSHDFRERLFAQNVIDYVIKDTPASLEYLLSLVERLQRNRTTKVLVVDDSKTFRQYLARLLTGYQFQVIMAASGHEALDALAANPDIKLVVTDYLMPDMNGVEMIKRMRSKHDQQHLSIIGLSSSGSHMLSAEFLKSGANDFINKPFLPEEFFCRVVQNVRMLDMVERLRDAATEDFLTGLKNRRHFFDMGAPLYANMKRSQMTMATAMIDLDHFKKINDSFGHDAGDVVLRQVSKRLLQHFRASDVITRFGGEEFAAIVTGMDPNHLAKFFDEIRRSIADTPIGFGDTEINVTTSIGVCAAAGASLKEMMDLADQKLYEAKKGGRNRVEIAWA